MSEARHLCIIIQTGPYLSENFDLAYSLAKAARSTGDVVSIFFYVDGVGCLNQKISSPGERNIADMVRELAEAGVRVAGCGACAKFRGITKDMVIPGAHMGSLVDLAEMLSEADSVMSLGF
ncbi:MAG: hypothetical protein HPY71_03550 [Firmicutes bacterium]|nr:hypothetical protein [Bacillota bacterium]